LASLAARYSNDPYRHGSRGKRRHLHLWGEILSVVDPELYSGGIESLRALNNDPGSLHKGEGLAAVLKI